MKILYFSVHQILEDDEVRLFQSLGHTVCSLGDSGPNGAVQTYRPPLLFTEAELELFAAFDAMGGKFTYCGDPATFVIPAPFVDLFDIVIVMHDYGFIRHHWPALSRRPVVWRTIGQVIEHHEIIMAPFRAKGMHIVRYAAVEAEAANYLGADALIRFYKPSTVYGGWTGAAGNVLTFSTHFRQRYPEDAGDFLAAVDGLPVAVGGQANEGMEGSIGMVSAEEQVRLYREAGCYLYGHGLMVPYTLNFIEAWMTGTPMVIHAPPDRRGPLFEIDRLGTDGVDCFICRDVPATRARLEQLLADPALAARIGGAGRETAKRLFSEDVIRPQWDAFLAQF